MYTQPHVHISTQTQLYRNTKAQVCNCTQTRTYTVVIPTLDYEEEMTQDMRESTEANWWEQPRVVT